MIQNLFLASVLLISQPTSGPSLDVLDLVMQAGWVVKGVMLLLVLSSIASWAIIFSKFLALRTALSENQRFADSVWASGSLEAASKLTKTYNKAPLTRVFEAGLEEYKAITTLNLEKSAAGELLETNLARSLQKSAAIESADLQKNLPFLASTASAAPFIGLFGTVWGIMTAFISIGATGASNLAVVAPGIAEALIATALGLFAAIPAAVFYNYFAVRLRRFSAGMNHFSTEFLNVAKRNL